MQIYIFLVVSKNLKAEGFALGVHENFQKMYKNEFLETFFFKIRAISTQNFGRKINFQIFILLVVSKNPKAEFEARMQQKKERVRALEQEKTRWGFRLLLFIKFIENVLKVVQNNQNSSPNIQNQLYFLKHIFLPEPPRREKSELEEQLKQSHNDRQELAYKKFKNYLKTKMAKTSFGPCQKIKYIDQVCKINQIIL